MRTLSSPIQFFKRFHQALQPLSKTQIRFLVRKIILDKHRNSLPTHEGGYMIRVMAESLASTPINYFENEQKETAKKRSQKVNERLVALGKVKTLKVTKNKTEEKSLSVE